MFDAVPAGLWLVVAITFQIGFGLCSIWGIRRGAAIHRVGMINYLLATVVSALLASFTSIGIRAPLGVDVWLLATVNGLSLVLSFYLFVHLIHLVGLSIPVAVNRLSIIVPILYSVLFWREPPDVYQCVGIAVFLSAVPIFSGSRLVRRSGRPVTIAICALLLFLLQGAISCSWMVFARLREHQWIETFTGSQLPVFHFVAISFAISAAVMVCVRLWGGGWASLRPGRLDWLPGTCLGLVNVGAVGIMVVALSGLAAALAWPIAGCAGVSISALLAYLFWGEPIDRRAVAGLALVVAALVLLNTGGLLKLWFSR